MHDRLLRVAVLAALGTVLMSAWAAPVAQSGNGEPGLLPPAAAVETEHIGRAGLAAELVMRMGSHH